MIKNIFCYYLISFEEEEKIEEEYHVHKLWGREEYQVVL